MDDTDLWTAAGFAKSSLAAIVAEQDWLLEVASRDPSVGVVSTAMAIEVALRTLSGDLGVDGYWDAHVFDLTLSLVQRGTLTSEVASSLRTFLSFRTRLVHASQVESTTEDVLMSGLELLYLLWTIPRPVHRVVRMIAVYKNPDGMDVSSNVRGILLATANEPDKPLTVRPFPTRRFYLPGQRLSWTWNIKVAVGQMWYQDPTTDTIRKAWDRSAEFVGTLLADPSNQYGPPSAEALANPGFQTFIERLFVDNGFTVERAVDAGEDLVLERNGLKWVAQLKATSRPVSVLTVQQLRRYRDLTDADYAVIITNGSVTPGAREQAQKLGVQIWNTAEAVQRLTSASSEL